MVMLPLHPSPLVGRDRELVILRERLDAALAGHGSLALISGEVGIGKTSLAAALCDGAVQGGALVLVGRCYDLMDTPPYGPWVELLGRYQRMTDTLPAPLTAFVEPGTGGAVTSQAALFQQMHAFFSAVAGQRPLVLLLDDLHWADPASLDLLRFLARDLAGVPLLILATYRSDEITAAHPLAQRLPPLSRESRAARLALQGLEKADVDRLIAGRYALSGDDRERLVSYLYERTDGNPFFTEEILRTLEEGRRIRPGADGWLVGDLTHAHVPPLVRQVIEGRLARLDDQWRQHLATGAVIGQEVPLPLWSAAGAVEERVLLDVVEHAAAAGLLEEAMDGARVRFVHALVREVVYAGTAPVHRRLLHRQVGEALAASSTPDPDTLAYHFQRATDARAVEWLIKAGLRAQQGWAWLTAAERYETALGLLGQAGAGERAWLLYHIAVLRQWTSPQAGIGLIEQAFTVATDSGDRVLAACALFYRGVLRCYTGELQRGVLDLQAGATALDALPMADRPRIHALDLTGEAFDEHNRWGSPAVWLALVGRYTEARALGERLDMANGDLPRADGRMHIPRATGHRALGMAYASLGEPDAAYAAYRRIYTALHESKDYHYAVTVTCADELERLTLTYRADRVSERRALATKAEEAWRLAGLQMPDAAHLLPAGTDISRIAHLPLLELEGRWAEARHLAVLVRSTQELASLRRIATRVLGALARNQGEPALAGALVDEVLPDGPAAEPGNVRFLDALTAQQLAIAVALDAGDLMTARSWLEMHDYWLAWSGTVVGLSEAHGLWARYYRMENDADRAHERALAALAHASKPRQPLALLAALRLLGQTETDAGRLVDAARHLDGALALADACAAPYERALVLLAQAELCAAGVTMGALRLVEAVQAICAPLGAAPALARADMLRSRLGDKEIAPSMYPAGLSAREVEILRLMAAGHTNRQIAAMLSLSERTVHAHVRNVFTKTHTDNRAAATAFAFRHDLA